MDIGRLEDLLSSLHVHALSDADLAREWEREGSRFAAISGRSLGEASAEGEAALRRFQEYFLLERRSQRYGVIPAITMWDRAVADLGSSVERLDEALFGSFVGIFLVREVDVVEGTREVEAEDLASGRCLTFARTDSDASLDPSNLVIGRVFPVGPTEFLFSSSCGVVQDPSVAAAVRADIGRLREERSHVRFSQLEFESLFFRRTEVMAPVIEDVEAKLHAFLSRGNHFDLDLDELAALADASDSLGAFIGPLLDKLAFETSCDLDEARSLLVSYWHARRSRREDGAMGEPDVPMRSEDTSLGARQKAVDAFEAGRRAGESLDALFERLERDLGLAEVDYFESDPETAFGESEADQTDPLGIEPIVDEYIWDRDRMGRPLGTDETDLVRDFASRIDRGAHRPASIDSMSSDCLREYLYTGFLPWLNRRRDKFRDAGFLERSWDRLEGFFQWLELEQGVEILEVFRGIRRRIGPDMKRLLGVGSKDSEPELGGATWNRVLEDPEPGANSLEVARLFQPDDPCRLRIEDPDARRLRKGDVILVAIEERAGGPVLQTVHRALPGAAGTFLEDLRARLSEQAD